MKKEIAPLVNSKLGIDPKSKEGRAIIAILSDKDMSKTLLVKTKDKQPNARFLAVKSWVKYVMWPRVVAEAGEIGRAVGHFAFQTAISVAVNHMVDHIKGDLDLDTEKAAAYKKEHPYRHSFKRYASRFEYKPSQAASGVQVGAGTLSYKFKGAREQTQMLDLLKEHALNLYQEKSKDAGVTSIGKEFFHITITPGDRIAISLDKAKIEQYCELTPEACGFFATQKNWSTRAEVYLRMIRNELQGFYDEAKRAEVF
jgi:hypothetical protein